MRGRGRLTGAVEWMVRWREGERALVLPQPATPYRTGARAAAAAVRSAAAGAAPPVAPVTAGSVMPASVETGSARAAPPGRHRGRLEVWRPYRRARARTGPVRVAPIRLGLTRLALIRPAAGDGASLIGECAGGPPAPAGPAAAAGGKLRIVVAGCRLLTDRLLDAAGPYAGLADFAAADCGLDPLVPEAHLDEPVGALPPGLERLGTGADALVLPPGVPPRSLAMALLPAVRVELRPACLLELIRNVRGGQAGAGSGGTAPGVALLLPAGAVSQPVAAVLEEHAPGAALLTYVGPDHLWGQLRLAARLRPARVLAEPAAAALARRAGLPAVSIYEGPGRCLVVHPLERAVAWATAARLRALSHERLAPAAGAGELDPIRLEAGAGLPARPGLEPAREVLALRSGRRFVLVPTASIVYFTSHGGLVTAHADGGEFWTDQSLSALEARLDPRHFLRLDASRLANLSRAAELLPWTHQRYRLRFADAARTELVLSRDVGRRLRALLGW